MLKILNNICKLNNKIGEDLCLHRKVIDIEFDGLLVCVLKVLHTLLGLILESF